MENKTICVGYARKNFNPTEPTPLGGYASPDARLSNNIINDVCATCLAIKDSNGISGLFFALDLCYIIFPTADACRKEISERTGVPFDNIFLSCSHTHSAPVTHTALPAGKRWIENLKFILADTAEEAIKDATAKTMAFTGKANCNTLNYVRRYKTAEGGWNALAMRTGTPVEHETEADSLLQVVKFAREGKKDIILTNFQVHLSGYHDGEKKGDVSPEFVGDCRDILEDENTLFMYMQGAAGNLTYGTKLASDVQKRATCRLYAEELCEKIKYALSKLHPIELGDVKCVAKEITLDIDHSKDDRKDDAKLVFDLIYSAKPDEARVKAAELGFESMYQARDIYERSRKPKSVGFKISAYSIGDIAFACAPCEMFCETGAIVKGSSPFEVTFICELTNGWAPYIPTSYAFPHGGYEATSCYYAPGSAEVISNNFVRILKEF